MFCGGYSGGQLIMELNKVAFGSHTTGIYWTGLVFCVRRIFLRLRGYFTVYKRHISYTDAPNVLREQFVTDIVAVN
jgi:hypothetical protein